MPLHVGASERGMLRAGSRDVLMAEQRQVLSQRHGTTMSHRTILKSYQPTLSRHAAPDALRGIPGDVDVRCAAVWHLRSRASYILLVAKAHIQPFTGTVVVAECLCQGYMKSLEQHA